jgi:hypothetical protein
VLGGSCCSASVSFAEDFTIPLEVVAFEKDVACTALQTLGVESTAVWSRRVPLDGLEVVALDAGVTTGAKGAVALVVMLRAEGSVVEDVEIDCLEGRVTFEADETAAVVSTCEAAV